MSPTRWKTKNDGHLSSGRSTTVPFHSGHDIAPTLLRQIAKDIGLTIAELLDHR